MGVYDVAKSMWVGCTALLAAVCALACFESISGRETIVQMLAYSISVYMARCTTNDRFLRIYSSSDRK